MALRHGKNADLTVNAVNLKAFCDSLSLNIDVDTAETSVFGQNYKTFLAGQGGGTFEISGHYDPVASTGPNAVLTGRLFQDSTAIVYYPGGNTTGQISYSFNGIITSYSESSEVGDKVSFSCSIQSTGTITIATVP